MRTLRALMLCLPLWPAWAGAAGFYVPDIGVRALGRGGAFVARADDLTAAWYNPAGLADLGGTRFHGDVAFVKQSVFHQRTDDLGRNIGFPVGNTAFPFTIPFLALSSDFGLRNLAFSVSVYGPYASTYRYPDDPAAAQRYALIESGVLEALYQVTVGWRIFPWLRVGASFQAVDVRANQKVAISLSGTRDNEANSDVRVRFDVGDHFTPNFHFGILASPTPFFDLGFSIKPPMPVAAEGSLKIDQQDLAAAREAAGLPNLTVRGENVGVEFTLPLVLRGGVRFHQPRWDVEADFVWERWTGFSRLEIKPRDIQFTLNSQTTPPRLLDPIIQERGYGDAFSIRVGSDLEIVPRRLSARLGYYFETSAIPVRSLNVSAVDMDKHGVTVGLSAKLGWFGISLAYAHVQLVENTVRDSIVNQINLAALAFGIQQQAPIVANGLYRSGYDILALGISIDIDTLAGWKRRP